jgi:hypothetical protein
VAPPPASDAAGFAAGAVVAGRFRVVAPRDLLTHAVLGPQGRELAGFNLCGAGSSGPGVLRRIDETFGQYRRGPVVKKIGEQLIPLLEAPPSFKHLRATVMEHG